MSIFSNDPSVSLNPVHFFALSCNCLYVQKKEASSMGTNHHLPSTQQLTNEEHFADIAMGWNEEGIALIVQVRQPMIQSFYPEIEDGDSVELFFDTRDLKTAGLPTRFCHHFFFIPQSAGGIEKGEKTRFRTEDSHLLCEADALFCETQKKKSGYQMKIFIPTECLCGYDPKQFNRLGFTYRVNRFQGKSQHFSVVSEDYQIDQQPSLWGSLQLTHENSSL